MDKAIAFNRRQCLCALICSIVVVVCVCIGVTINLTNLLNDDFENIGIKTFFMFTVNSNILVAFGMMMVIPYAIDGLRKNNYHLSNWVIVFLHAGTTTIALTFLVSLFFLAPTKGFEPIFTGSNFFLHGVCPIFTIVSFLFFISDHRIKLKESFWSIVPVILYGIVYFIMVLVIGEENGGWSDFYGFATKLPIWVSVTVLPLLSYGVAFLLMLKHNHLCKSRKKREAALYKANFEGADVRALIAEAGRTRAAAMTVRDIVVPARVIDIMVQGSDCTVDEGCRIYLSAYLDELDKKNA